MDRFLIKALGTCAVFLMLVVLSAAGLVAQTPPPAGTFVVQGSAYGISTQMPLRFAEEPVPGNQVSLSVGASAFYDDNVLATNLERLSDEALSFNARLAVFRQTKNLVVGFDYRPFYMLYHQLDQFDRLNHYANLTAGYKLTPRFILGLRDGFSYLNGVYPSLVGQGIMSGPVPPTALNQTIFAYTTRTLSNMTVLDLTFVKSRRTSLTLSGSYNQRKFGSQIGAGRALYDSTEVSGGLQFQYLVTEHTNFGLLFLHQDFTYQGGQVFGYRQRPQIESAFLSVAFRLSPTVTLTVFGGPQYVHILGQPFAGASLASNFQGAGGGSITKQVRKTALDLSFERSVSDSGGLYASVVSTNATLGVRRRIVGRWEADLHGRAGRADTSLYQSANARIDAITGGIEFHHPLSSGSEVRVSYESTHQISKGNLPVFADFDRNQVTIGFDFQLKTAHLGQ